MSCTHHSHDAAPPLWAILGGPEADAGRLKDSLGEVFVALVNNNVGYRRQVAPEFLDFLTHEVIINLGLLDVVLKLIKAHGNHFPVKLYEGGALHILINIIIHSPDEYTRHLEFFEEAQLIKNALDSDRICSVAKDDDRFKLGSLVRRGRQLSA
jgi:hypothetical protein